SWSKLEIVDETSDDPALLSITNQLERTPALAETKTKVNAVWPTIAEHTSKGEYRSGIENPAHSYYEHTLNDPADADMVRQTLETVYRHTSNTFRIEAPEHEDPIAAIEAARAAVYEEVQAAIGIDHQVPMDDIREFEELLGLPQSTNRLVVTDRADPLLEAYSDWPEKIMQHFATTADIAYYN